MSFKYKVWCTYHNDWEKHDMFLDCNGKLWHMCNGRLVIASLRSHKIILSSGIEDKNKVEIYQDDIVLDNNRGRKYKVVLDTDSAAFILESEDEWLSMNEMDMDSEVIGNINKNPDLLPNR